MRHQFGGAPVRPGRRASLGNVVVEVCLLEYIDHAIRGCVDSAGGRVVGKIVDSARDGQGLQLLAGVAVEDDDLAAPATDE